MRERPKKTDPDVRRRAAERLVATLDADGVPGQPEKPPADRIEQVADALLVATHDSGIRLARHLERIHGWKATAELVSALCKAHAEVARAHRRQVAAWVSDEAVRPAHGLGEVVLGTLPDGTNWPGYIVAIDASLARYTVAIPPFGRVSLSFEHVSTRSRRAA